MARILRMPSLQELPEGPRRRFVGELFDLFREAKRPDLRFISETIGNDETLKGMASRETIRRMLTGKVVPAKWETAEAVFLTLCRLAGHEPNDDRWPESHESPTYAWAFEKAWHEALDAGAQLEDEPPF